MALTFCGASVIGFNCNIGWNEQVSQFECSVVENPDNGDFFLPPPLGTPVYFVFERFRFFGLLQKWVQSNGVDGLATYKLTCVDPREILECGQIITGTYFGAVPINNLYNVFGWWENLEGFGSSLANDTGMPWVRIAQALTVMCNSLTGSFGTALLFRGVRYGLDLSELPLPPIYYRIPGPSVGLMEAISQICTDGGCDYFVELDGFTIKIRTRSRVIQPPLGSITALQASGVGVDLISSSAGIEIRNEVTSTFLIGGEVKSLYLAPPEAIFPFWGLDADGLPILGTGSGLQHTMLLNAVEVADIVGGKQYICTVFEMCAALVGYNTWATYMQTARTADANLISLNSEYGGASVPGKLPIFAEDGTNLTQSAVIAANQAVALSLGNIRSQRMFQFVRKYATDYMGKQFMVAIPFTLVSQDSDTLKVVYSQEPTDGGFLPEGSEPLGLPVLAEDNFKTADGRWAPFALYADLTVADLTRVTNTDAFLGTNGLYMKVTVQDKIYTIPGPAVLMQISNPIYEIAQDGVGGLGPAAAILGIPQNTLINMREMIAGGFLQGSMHPPAHQPDFVAIPLKSNVSTYGPWFLEGVPGKVNLKHDSSLVPWNYGGYELLNATALSYITQAITTMQIGESGSLSFAGPPRWSLGDLLQVHGPDVTGIDVSYSAKGVTTNIRMQTYTPRFGIFSKQNADRFRKIANNINELRKNMRKALNLTIQDNNVTAGGYQGWLANMNSSISRQGSPHTTLIGAVVDDPDTPGLKRTSIASATLPEVRSGCLAHRPEGWQQTAIMSLTGLIRPVSMGPNAKMALYASPKPAFTNIVGISSFSYNPFATGHDINVIASGDTYNGMNRFQQDVDDTTGRIFVLRGPLLLSGWGYTVNGKVIPGDVSGNPGTNYVDGTLQKPHLWPTGPVDLLWDQFRGVWTSHDILVGITNAAIPANGSGEVAIFNNSVEDNGMVITAFNWFNGAGVGSGVKVILGFCVTVNSWYIIAADCV